MTSQPAAHCCAAMALLVAVLFQTPIVSAAAADLTTPAMKFERGRVLYERHCIECHTPGIHRRPDRLPMTVDELRGLVDTFRRVQSLGWTPEEVDDVVEYLNVTRYRFTR